jgi:4'-phosphopantetheinyl transferase
MPVLKTRPMPSGQLGHGRRALLSGEIHVWSASLECDPRVLLKLTATLTPDEMFRATRFRCVRDRDHFIAARGTLRELLGSYENRSPAELEFSYGKQGKPILRTSDGSTSDICFNVAHSHGLAVYAIAYDRNVGIDVELIDPEFAASEIAARYFSAREARAISLLPSEQRAEGFFHCWTRKEAYVKAHGAGLGIPLTSFEVTVTPGTPAQFLGGIAPGWQLDHFTPAPGYVGAIAYDGDAGRVLYWGNRDVTTA